MRHAAIGAALTLSLAWTLGCPGCQKPAGPEPAVAPVPAEPGPARSALEPGARGELQNIAANWQELAPLVAKDPLSFRAIEAKAWAMAGSADELLKLAERPAGSPALPPKGASPEEIRKLAFAVGAADDKLPEALRDIELVSINAKSLALAASNFDRPGVAGNWAKLDLVCKRLCGALSVPAAEKPAGPAAAPEKAPATAPSGKQ